MKFQLNSPEGKAILAKARRGDFAHPGEIDAIQLVVAGVEKLDIRRVLDVGCGRGGTAAWFKANNWGQIFGLDIDQVSIDYARATYPGIEFLTLDVERLREWNTEPFDLVYLLNSFYAFPDQRLALKSIRSVCRSGATLCLFDYARCQSSTVPAALGPEIGNPIVLEDLHGWLKEAGWIITDYEDCTDKYVTWYAGLLAAFEREQKWIEETYGEDWLCYFLNWYGLLRDALASRILRGVIFRAMAT
ncbi:MAG: class I SAM-dependent methyltransferase [Methylocystis sp.]